MNRLLAPIVVALIVITMGASALAQPDQAPPTFTWQTASPESQGMSKAKLDALKDSLAARKTTGFLVARNDKIVYEWYAEGWSGTKPHGTASLAKAVVGGLSLAVAMTDGKISIDDPAAKFVPQWRDDPQKSKIKVRHLGSHTSGMEDSSVPGIAHPNEPGWKGEFWKRQQPPVDPFTISRDKTPLLFEPGQDLQYSNPGIAMLTYAVTAAIKDSPRRDVRTLLRERVMQPIGAPDKEWSCGYGQTFDVDGLTLVGSWGGGNYSAYTAARIGRLMLREGDWDGRRIISRDAVRLTTGSAGHPGGCGMGWWTNALGRYAGVPRDAYWGAGAGDQLLFVVPSLNLIMVRNGETIAPLPGEPPIPQDDVFTKYHDFRAHVLFEPLVAAIQPRAAVPQKRPEAPSDQKRSAAPAGTKSKTRVALVNGRWEINGKLTNPGSRAEGLLMNVRMVNATFEDTNPRTCPRDFDPDRNTARFIEQIPSYAAHGVNAFTLCLQGGMPGYEGAINSAFQSDGSLRPEYLSRVARVIDECDNSGLGIILGCYYQRQSKVLRDDDALRAGVINVVNWIRSRGWQNVLLEIANEYPHRGFVHPLIRDPKGQASLLRLAKQHSPELLVTASGYGTGAIDPEVAEVCDFLTPHFNSTPVDQIDDRLKALQRFGKPIVVNEDDKTAQQASAALEACVAAGGSYGLMLQQHNQRIPFHFDGAADDPIFYATLKQITSAVRKKNQGDSGAATYFPPPDRQGGWRTPSSTDDAGRLAGIDVAKLDAALESAKANTKNGGLLVVCRGWLVYEKYFGLGDRNATPNLASCGKSFTSIAVGILMAERPDLFPDGLHQKVFTSTYLPREAFPLSDSRKAEIQLGQLLSFTAGIRGNNPCRVRGAEVTINPAGPDGSSAMIDAVALGLQDATSGNKPTSTQTLWCEPGEGYSYATASAHIASMIVRHVSGMELEEFVRSRLAEPMGLGPFTYGYKQSAARQHTPGGGGIAASATDMLRFGYLMLREGRWGDRQLVPADYVRHCGHVSPFNPHAPYSLQFDVNTDGQIPDFPRDTFWKSGSGGHTLYVVPSLDLVVWKLGGRDAQYDERDTGVKLNTRVIQRATDRSQWTASLTDREAQRRVLIKIIGALVDARGQDVR